MKKILVGLMLLAVNAGAVATTNFAGQKTAKDPQTVAMSGNLINESGLAYTTTFTFDAAPFTRLSAQVNYGSTTFSNAAFSDGAECFGSFKFLSNSGLSTTTLAISGKKFVGGVDYAIKASAALTAANIASSITALGYWPNITWSNTGAVVYASATINGPQNCLNFISSDYTKISTVNMTGGVSPAFSLQRIASSYGSVQENASAKFYLPSHGFTKALPLLYTANSASIGGLTDQTTYYAIVVDANNIQLATTSARAVAGAYLIVTSTTSQGTAHAPVLAPCALTGTPSFVWQVSNDGDNYVTSTSSAGVSMSAYSYPFATGLVDFSTLAYRYLRLAYTAPTWGASKLQVVIHAKQN